jgi:hypothetical protein
VDPTVIDYLQGTNGKAKSSFATFCGDGEGWFVKHVAAGGWDVNVPDNYPHKIFQLRQQFNDFDVGLQSIIFGSEGTHLYGLGTGFVAELNGKADNPEHPLYKVCAAMLNCPCLTCLGGYRTSCSWCRLDHRPGQHDLLLRSSVFCAQISERNLHTVEDITAR